MPRVSPTFPARYRDAAYVGAGAFGEVWRAVSADGRVVALKVLAAPLACKPDVVWGFGTEYRRLSELDHPAFPRAIEEGLTADGRPFYAMSFLPGEPLTGALAAVEVRAVLSQVAVALEHLHGRGLVHGDLKAANLLRDAAGAVAVLDVGAARPIGDRGEGLAGTLEYMAPEVLHRVPAAAAADWYALGTLGYWLISGRTPFESTDPAVLVRAQLSSPPPALPSDESGLAAGVMGLLAKDPATRLAALPAFFHALGLAGPAVGACGLRTGVWVPRAAVDTAATRLLVEDVVLSGGPGTGKSRALDALQLAMRLAGRTWIAATCGAGDAPGAVMRAVLRQAASTEGEPVLAAWLDGRVLPAWVALEPRARKLALFRAVTEALTRDNLVIGLDDWHLADGTSRELVAHVRRTAPQIRWCLAGEDMVPEALSVAVWTPADREALVAAKLGAPGPEALLAAFDAAGLLLPGPIEGLLGHWYQQGDLRATAAGWVFTAPGTADAADPFTVIWRERLAGLTSDAVAAGRLLAGVPAAGAVSPAALAGGLGLTATALGLALDALTARGLLIATGAGVKLVPGPAALLLTEVPAAARTTAAAGLARAIVATARGDMALEQALTELDAATLRSATEAALEGDDDDLATTLATASARLALDMLALDDAQRLATAAGLRMSAKMPVQRRIEAPYVGAEAARLKGQAEEAVPGYEAAIALAEAENLPIVAAHALLGLAKCRQMRGQYPEALALATRAEASAVGAPELGARAANMLARIELFRGAGSATARATCARAAALAREAGATAMLACALNLHGVLLVQDDPTAQDVALAMITEAMALAESVGDLVELSAALENLGNAHHALGNLREAREAFARGGALCRLHGITVEGLSLDMNEALAAAELGDADADARAAEVLAQAEVLGRAFVRMITLGVGAQAAWREARTLGVLAALDTGLILARETGNKLAEELLLLYSFEAALVLGQPARATADSAAAHTLIAASQNAESAARHDVLEAARRLAEGDLDGALTGAGAHLADANIAVAQAASLVVGRAHLRAGRPDDARPALAQAFAIAEGWQAPWHLAQAAYLQALAAPDATSAEAWAREALAYGTNPYAAAGAGATLRARGRASLTGDVARRSLATALADLDEPARMAVLVANDLPTDALADLAEPPPVASAAVVPAERVYDALASLAEATDETQAHERLLGALVGLARADRGYMLSYARGRLVEALTLGVDYAAEVAAGFSTSIAEEVLLTGRAVHLVDASVEAQWREAASVQALGVRTVFALPVGTPDRTLGVVYMDREALDPVLSAADMQALQTLADAAAARVAGWRREAALTEALALQRDVLDVAVAVAGATTPEGRRAHVLAAALGFVGATRAYWLAPTAEGWTAWATRTASGLVIPFEPAQVSQSVLAEAARVRAPLCLIETDPPEGWQPGQSVLALGLRRIWCLPVGLSELVYLDAESLDTTDPRAGLARLEELLARLGPLF